MQSTIIALALLVGGCLCKADPCQVGQHFQVDQPKRSIAYVTPDDDTPTCDQYRVNTSAWYRFTSYTGGLMPEQCVPIKHCGTYATIWMNDNHPTVLDGEVNKTVCANYGRGDCCEWSATIKVKKCEESAKRFFVYQLADPEACYVGYCVGNETVCPAGEVLSESKKCIDEYPSMTSIQLAAPVIDNKTNVTLKDIVIGGTGDESIEVAHFSFKCTIQISIENDVAPEDVGFDVVMTFDGQVDASQASLTTTAADPHVVFGEEYLYGHLGTLVACRARAYRTRYKDNEHYWSPSMTSNTFWAGIRRRQNDDESITWNVDPSTATLKLELVSTIPVTFWHLVSNPQKQLHKYTAGIARTEVFKDPCELEVTETNTPGFKVELKETSEDGTWHFDIQFNAFKTGNTEITSLFGGYTMTNIQIKVIKQRRFMECSSFEEPHIKPFNGREYMMTTHVGDFYLWKDERPNILFEVQTRIYLCNDGGEFWQGTCNCGVAVREGNDVIVMDFCNRTDAIPVFTLEDKSGTARPIVGHDGEFTKIVMPSGNRLNIKVIPRDWKRLNIYLEIPQKAVTYDSWGLCNALNSTQSNSYRVKGTSLFDTRTTMECKDLSEMPLRVCECVKQQISCSGSTAALTTGSTCAYNGRSRRSAELSNERIHSDDYISPDELHYEFEYDTDTVMIPLTWPTRQGRTESEVRTICENKLLESAALNSCEQLVNIDDLISSCITDIQITDDLSLAASKLNVLENLCGLAVTRNTYVTPDDGTEWPVPPGYMTISESQQLTRDICPSRCSNRGTCHSRKCSCSPGFGGTDCSVNTTVGPTLVNLQTNGLCDVRTRECRKTRVVVENVMYTDTITCIWAIRQNGQHISRGSFLSRGLITCDHTFSSVLSHGDNVTVTPATNQTLTLTLSNDGALVSNALHLTIYDSLCVTCFSNHTCTPRITACSIGGRCYIHFQTNPDAPCLHCDVTKSTTTWSVADELRPQVFTMNNTVWIYEDEEIVEKMKVGERLSAPAQLSLSRPYPGISLSVDGVLRFTPGHVRNQTIELSAVDQCGRRVEIQTTVVALPCPCHNEATCSKENHFTYKPDDLLCLCTSGYHGNLCEEVEAAVTGITVIPIVSTNIHTGPSDLTETLSDEPGRHPTTHLPSDPLPTWSEWGSWGNCSDERCLRYRHRLCVGHAATGCQGHHSDVFWCRDCVAYDLKNEKEEGIILVIGQGSEKEALVNLHKVSAFLVESVNVYCTGHGEECCSLVSAKRTSSLPLIMTSRDYIRLAQGSPKMLPDYQISFKWVVNVWTTRATETCQGSRTPKRDTGSRDHYLPAALIYKAVKDKATDLEQLLGVDLISIRQPAKETETTKQDNLPLILSIVAVVLATLFSGCIVYACKAKCRKQHKTAAYASSNDSTYAHPVAKETAGDTRNVYATLQSQSPIALPSMSNGKDENDYATIE